MTDGCFCRFVVILDTIRERGQTRSNGVLPVPRAVELGIGPISVIVWTVDWHLITRFETGERQFLILYRLFILRSLGL